MNFFEQQRLAKRQTSLLVFFFIVFVILLSFLNTVVLGLFFHSTPIQMRWIFGVNAMIFLGSTWIAITNARSGSRVAEWLGGRVLEFPLQKEDEKRLYNIVEEMAIASGCAVPRVYILENEMTINAFAAGTDPGHLVVAVTRGALEHLQREELQAVIGHEFSHLLNEDMGLNVKLSGVVSGFQIFMKMGYIILRGGGGRRRRSGKGDFSVQVLGLSLVFLVFGSVGYFFSRLLQSMISKQREFLADASSVQFTRNPQALAEALVKISSQGSDLSTPNKLAMAHIFFAESMKGFWSQIFSTHPAVEERIRKITPRFSLQQHQVNMKSELQQMSNKSQEMMFSKAADEKKRSENLTQQARTTQSARLSVQSMMDSVASPDVAHFRFVENLLGLIPNDLKAEMQKSHQAEKALEMLVCTNKPVQQGSLFETQLNQLLQKHPGIQLTILKLAAGLLRQKSVQERQEVIARLRMGLQDRSLRFLSAIYFLLIEDLLKPGILQPSRTQTKDLRLVLPQFLRLVYFSEKDFATSSEDQVLKDIFNLIPLAQTVGARLSKEGMGELRLEDLRQDIQQLNLLTLPLKKKIAEILFSFYKRDQILSEKESEDLRAISLSLRIPLPPLIQQELSH